MKFLLESQQGNKIYLEQERPEFILGATAVLLNKEWDYNDKFINPVTNELLPIIKSEENRLFVPAHIQEDFEYAKKNNLNIKQVIAPYFYGIGEEKVRNNIKTQFRHSVIAIIKYEDQDRYLCLDCKNRECKSFILGGIEDEESVIEAALREIKEETGYINVKIDRISDFSLYNHFYAGYKGVNRYAVLEVVFGHLVNEERVPLSDQEDKKHVVKWIKKEELKSFINVNNNIYVLDELFNGPKAYTLEEGKIINSKEFDKMDVKEARDKIIDLISNTKMQA